MLESMVMMTIEIRVAAVPIKRSLVAGGRMVPVAGPVVLLLGRPGGVPIGFVRDGGGHNGWLLAGQVAGQRGAVVASGQVGGSFGWNNFGRGSGGKHRGELDLMRANRHTGLVVDIARCNDHLSSQVWPNWSSLPLKRLACLLWTRRIDYGGCCDLRLKLEVVLLVLLRLLATLLLVS